MGRPETTGQLKSVLNTEGMGAHCTNVLAKFKLPRVIELVPEAPKTLGGKIRRIDLMNNEEASKGSGARGQFENFYHEFPELKSK